MNTQLLSDLSYQEARKKGWGNLHSAWMALGNAGVSEQNKQFVTDIALKLLRQNNNQKTQERKRVAVEDWTMHSDPGYIASSGRAQVHLVPEDKAASCAASETALYDLAKEYPRVHPDEFEETEAIEWRSGVCNYQGEKGILEVPDGMVAIQRSYRDISTNDQVHYHAEVLNAESLIAFYHKRIERYKRLIQRL